ncbi:MAG: fibronectin type III domain-containing protein, partial [Candidatus Paceibacterota bacterium]
VSPTQVTVSIPASDLLTAGTYSITVFNPLPGGGTSNAQTFTVVLPPDTTAPADISNLTISNPTTNSVDLSWMAPGDDNNTGTAASYDLRYSLSLITSANFGAATQVTGLPSPSAAGVGENFTVTGLSPNTLYYFAIKASDEVPNISGISNVPSTTTVATADTTAPSAVSDLAASSPTTSTITLTWLSPGNDGNSGTAASYDIRYSTSNITEGNWVSSTPVSGEPAPLIAGTAQSMIVSGLLDSTSYYFALKTSDAVGNVSGLSNVPNLSTSVPLLPTVSISANPTTITLGQFFNILWSSSNVTLCNASGDWIGSKATTGTESITPISVGTKNYVLACSGSNGTASSSAAVTVNNATLPTASADLSITKTSSPNPVTAGNSLTYTLTVANSGPDDASNVVVSDTLPSALTSTTISSSQGSCSAFPCNLGTIANGNSASITVTASVDSGTTGTITNIASVSSDADDPVSSNNTSTQNTTVSTPTPTPTPTSTGGGAATGTVSPTTVKFSGKAFPGASVLIVDKDIHTEGVVSQDSVVNKDGSFSASFSGIFQSQHSFGLVIKDKDGRTTQTKFFNIDTVSNSLTQKDIFVSPTVGLPERTITRGSNVTVVGFATPKNIVSVEIDDKIKKEVNAGNDGSYKVAMETGALEFGTHSIRVKQIDPTQKRESDYSPTNTFIVSNLTSPKTDLNGDGSVNIKDWSMFLSRWNSKDESQKKALDLNGDGKVDILDFSMFIRTVKK